jgi:serine/threonine protein kinase/tetratricopeptide (TPR) repeat protein
MPLPPGSHLGIYEILAPIGSGGMGEVYRARDPRLGREVAIKTVRAKHATDEARARLWREARAAASVNHPGICQIYDVGEIDSAIFIVMELLAGESLERRLADGPMPLDDAVRATLGILRSLDALHRRGIVHRDLKPSNVFIADGEVKLLDFGLARPPGALGVSDLTVTQVGVVVGTPRYMAPEQWTGAAPDPRIDLFAVGVLLFEMLTGKPAFPGADLMQVYHSVMSSQPPALTGSSAITAVDAVVHRALEKRPDDRYPTAEAMANALRAATTGTRTTTRQAVRATTRVIVLPFRLARADPDLDFLSFSLADAVTVSLAGFDSLVVRSTIAGTKHSTETLDLRAIASDLAVDVVLYGHLLTAGDKVRLTAQLVETPSGSVVWSQMFEAPRHDIIELQDQLARRVVESLSGPLSAREAGRLRRDLPASTRAYEFYLRANQVSYDPAQLPVAEALYRSALAEDPDYAPAWARLGRVCRLLAKYGNPEAGETNLTRAHEAFQHALTLDPDCGIAHNLYTSLEIETLGRSKEAMARLLSRVRLQAAEPEIFSGLVVACRYCGLLDASLAADRHARRLDPAIRTSVMFTYFMRGEWERAMLADDQEMKWINMFTLPMLGRSDEALEVVRQAESRTLPPVMRLFVAVDRAALEGKRDACIAIVEKLRFTSAFDPEGFYLAVRALAHLGAAREALDLLEDTIEGGFFCPTILVRDPWLDSLRSDSRFNALVGRAEARSRDAEAEFRQLGGERLLGLS